MATSHSRQEDCVFVGAIWGVCIPGRAACGRMGSEDERMYQLVLTDLKS